MSNQSQGQGGQGGAVFLRQGILVRRAKAQGLDAVVPVPVKVKLVIQDATGAAVANAPYELEVDSQVVSKGNAQTDGTGLLEETVSKKHSFCELRVWPTGKTGDSFCFDIELSNAAMAAASDPTGAQMRLTNLGYYAGEVDGADRGTFKEAIRTFHAHAAREPKSDLPGAHAQLTTAHDG